MSSRIKKVKHMRQRPNADRKWSKNTRNGVKKEINSMVGNDSQAPVSLFMIIQINILKNL